MFQSVTWSERVKISVKNQKNAWLLLKLLGKWLSYKLRRFWMIFDFFFPFNPFVKLEKYDFCDSNNSTQCAKSISQDITKKLIEYSFKKVLVKAMFSLTVFEICCSKVVQYYDPHSRSQVAKGLNRNARPLPNKIHN